MKPKIFVLLFSRYIRRTAFIKWSEKDSGVSLTSREVGLVLNAAWDNYTIGANQLSKQANIGNWFVMNFGYLTLSAFQALVDFGLDETSSIELIRDITWHVTSKGAKLAERFSKRVFRDQLKQLDFFVSLVMKTLFSRPGYQFSQGTLENGLFLDVHQCPAAELMKLNDGSELCIESWCNVDFGLVEILGGRLIRTGTIAMGKEKCDFRIYRSQSIPVKTR